MERTGHARLPGVSLPTFLHALGAEWPPRPFFMFSEMAVPLSRAWAAEGLGTLALVIFGPGAAVVQAQTGVLWHLGVAAVFGLSVAGAAQAVVANHVVVLQEILQAALRDSAVSSSLAQGQAYPRAEWSRSWLYQSRNRTVPSRNSCTPAKSSRKTNSYFRGSCPLLVLRALQKSGFICRQQTHGMDPFLSLLSSTPDLSLLDLNFDQKQRIIRLHLALQTLTAACPHCHCPSSHLHSRYPRQLLDLPWADWTVHLALTALAIVDDLGAVLVIALFYTSGLKLTFLALAALTWGAALYAGWRGAFSLKLYAVLGVLLWFFVLESGLHATIAGVLLALAVPIRRPNPSEYLASLTEAARPGPGELVGARLRDLEDLLERAQSPLHRLEHALHPFVTFLVLPVFALVNAGVPVTAGGFGTVSLGVLLGLVLGKPLGVVGGAWLAVRLGLASLPRRVTWMHMVGAGLLAGIGFTMSLFVSNLAFGDAALLTQAKLGVLLASVVAAILGAGWLLLGTRRRSVASVTPARETGQP